MVNDKVLNVSEFIKEVVMKQIMGPTLDLARVSNMGERQFSQFQRSVKNLMYDAIDNANKIICEYDDFETTRDILVNENKEQEK